MSTHYRAKGRVFLCRLAGLFILVSLISAPAGATLQSAPAGPARLAYAVVRDGTFRLFTMDVDSGEPLMLPRPGIGPAWSPDHTQLAFLSDDGGLYVVNSDGSRERRLTEVGEIGAPFYGSPISWSPDGRRIAFDSADGARTQVFVINADGTGRLPLAALPGSSIRPVWSPDGRRLAFLHYDQDRDALYVVGADGTGLKQLVSEDANLKFFWDSSVAWTPDGRGLVFEANGRPTGDSAEGWIFTVSADGGEATRFVRGFSPVWSPDGRRLAFVSGEDGQVHVVNADGTGGVRVTPEGAQRLLMRWSPDGRRMAVISLNPDNTSASELMLGVATADNSGFRHIAPLLSISHTRPYAMLPIGRLLFDW